MKTIIENETADWLIKQKAARVQALASDLVKEAGIFLNTCDPQPYSLSAVAGVFADLRRALCELHGMQEIQKIHTTERA